MMDERGERVSFRPAISWRVIIIALILMPIHSLLVIYMETITGIDVSFTSLMIPTIFLFFFLTLLNAFLQRFLPRYSFSYGELVILYVMLIISVSFSTVGMSQILVPQLANLYHHATPENEWASFFKYFPKWFVPQDEAAIKNFFEGGHAVPWRVWLLPVAVWALVMFALGTFMLCLMAIFRKSWVERERLPFPIVYLPLEMSKDSLGFFKNKIMWLGFALPVLIEGLNGLHSIYPAIPPFPLYPVNLTSYISQAPWKHIGNLYICFWPFVIGIAYILTTDVSFSCWFFFLLTKLENLFAGIRGWKEEDYIGPESRFPFDKEQSVGALIGIAIFCLWAARPHLKNVFKKAITGDKDIDDKDEPISYRLAVLGLFLSFIFLIGFSCISGMSLLLALIFFLVFFTFMLVFARLRAEAGSPWTMRPNMYLQESVVMATGTTPFSIQSLAIFGFFYWMTAYDRGFAAPMSANQVEGLKMADSAQIRNKKLMTWVLLLAIVTGIIVAIWANITFLYQAGAGTGKVDQKRMSAGVKGFESLQDWVKNPRVPDIVGLKAVSLSLIFTLLLVFIRSKLLWWPFHPVGYFMGVSWNMDWAWCPIFVGWLSKVLIIRYGGAKLYRNALPFFLGMILGHYFIAVFWGVLGEILGVPLYGVFGD